ncbi:hypothetical protein EDC04DRAFT_2728756 [Pisolithus marmoratus]|nr:hypothetical protein EDC04DRAFT_2728756 [Pisolithus marmoratus]
MKPKTDVVDMQQVVDILSTTCLSGVLRLASLQATLPNRPANTLLDLCRKHILDRIRVSQRAARQFLMYLVHCCLMQKLNVLYHRTTCQHKSFNLSHARRHDKLQETRSLELDSKRASQCLQQTHQGHPTPDTPPDKVWGVGVHSLARADGGNSTDIGSTVTKLKIQ